jgi:phosphate transport system protein
MLDNDAVLAAEVKRGDAEINQMEMEIDAACIEVVARRQPAASDLRFIIGVFKTIAELERMGDESKRVAKMSAAERASVLPVEINTELRHMGELVQNMLHDVLDAFARMDASAAVAVARSDISAVTALSYWPFSIGGRSSAVLSSCLLYKICTLCQRVPP